MNRLLYFVSFALLLTTPPLWAQSGDDDIWREVDLKNVDYKKVKSYCQRLYCYYRTIEDGILQATKGDEVHKFQLYRINEGICELDIRYKKDTDEGSTTLVGRNLVHPDRANSISMDFYELTPYTFLEKARRDPKHFRLEPHGDTTRIYAKEVPMGTAVRDRANSELRIDYNALAPDTSLTLNMLILKARAKQIDAKAVYRMEDDEVDYVPQGDLKHIVFEGDMEFQLLGDKVVEDFHGQTDIYVDSVVYMTQEQYRADKKINFSDRLARSGYTDADIDRLKLKLGVPSLTVEQLERIEEQRDWDDAYEHWKATAQKQKAMEKKLKKQLQGIVNEK